ncbi:hypothetical protein DM82_4737 [Burkholderia oklahomensis]|uniref:Uncharacterized protein n=1 Tax=Burkholderia oklahomensis TaxID=342113 RepID=A0AAI8FQV9_9BURK|nr:hypothetical protein DM82_4737 [Burkholderia oklahomensis]
MTTARRPARCVRAGRRARSHARAGCRTSSPRLRKALCRQYDDFGKTLIHQSLGARMREISTSLRTKSVENPRVENSLWIVDRSMRGDGAARRRIDSAAGPASRFRLNCRTSDASGKVSSDQCVEHRILSLSTSLPTKNVEKAASQSLRRELAECFARDAIPGVERPSAVARVLRARCRLCDVFGKMPADQCVERRMLRMSASLPTKIVEKLGEAGEKFGSRICAGRSRQGNARGRRTSSGAVRRRERKGFRRGALPLI